MATKASALHAFYSRGLRLNKGNKHCFELFEQLSYASIILERRRVLGLDTGRVKRMMRGIKYGNQLVIPQLPGEAEESINTNNEDAQAKVMQGALATIV